ncbi:MAG TPA: hypothetical protein VG963_26410, partial [Polyangiaceae bacterium]|nr:hypothetical protein [Polyangiaceae bacterium]
MGATASTAVNSALPGVSNGVSNEGNPNTSGLVGADPSMNGELAPNPRALGAACVTAADCDAPGFCVDGVCCSSACTDLCAACNLPGQEGTCSAAPSDAACAQLTCPGQSTDCRQLDTSQLSLNCESFGKCRASADCADVIEPTGTSCADGAGSCDGNGACNVQGKASLGETCASDGDCAEGHCVAGAGGAQ